MATISPPRPRNQQLKLPHLSGHLHRRRCQVWSAQPGGGDHHSSAPLHALAVNVGSQCLTLRQDAQPEGLESPCQAAAIDVSPAKTPYVAELGQPAAMTNARPGFPALDSSATTRRGIKSTIPPAGNARASARRRGPPMPVLLPSGCWRGRPRISPSSGAAAIGAAPAPPASARRRFRKKSPKPKSPAPSTGFAAPIGSAPPRQWIKNPA
jgi:hypothetical protein